MLQDVEVISMQVINSKMPLRVNVNIVTLFIQHIGLIDFLQNKL